MLNLQTKYNSYMSKLVMLGLFFGWVIFVLLLVRKLDRHEPEPFHALLSAFGIGAAMIFFERMVFRVFVCKLYFSHDLLEFAVRLTDEYSNLPEAANYANHSRLLFSSFIVGGMIKEGLKGMAFYWILRKFVKEINDFRDPIIYALLVGLGFACGDFVLHYYVDNNPLDLETLSKTDYAALRRNLFSVYIRYPLIHFVCSALMGYLSSHHLYDFSKREMNIPGFILLLLVLMIIHGVLSLLFVHKSWSLVILGSVCLLVIVRILIRELHKSKTEPLQRRRHG